MRRILRICLTHICWDAWVLHLRQANSPYSPSWHTDRRRDADVPLRSIPQAAVGKSVAVLPQTVVVPAGIPSLEPCLGVVGLNVAHLVPETWACTDHAVARAGGRVAGRVAGRVEGQGRGHAPPHTRLPARPPPAIANLVGASRWRTASRQFSSTVMPPSQLLLTVPFSQLLSTLPFLQLLSTLSVLLSAMHVLLLLTTAGHTTAGCRLQALLR